MMKNSGDDRDPRLNATPSRTPGRSTGSAGESRVPHSSRENADARSFSLLQIAASAIAGGVFGAALTLVSLYAISAGRSVPLSIEAHDDQKIETALAKQSARIDALKSGETEILKLLRAMKLRH